jgi:phosphoribosylanthranilate isomerase
MVRVKICGITNLEDAEAAIAFGADALGFVFYEGSPRCVSPEGVSTIVEKLPPYVVKVGVFVDENPEGIRTVMEQTGLTVAQFHGDEPPEACTADCTMVKAIRVRNLRDLEPLKHYRVAAFLLDTYDPGAPGGTGRTFNWDIAVEAKRFGRIILAGGLTPDNVARAVEHVMPYAVDVSSGVEATKGKKDLRKLELFIGRAKGVANPS